MDASKPTMNVAIPPPAPHKKSDEAPVENPEPAGQQGVKLLEPRLGLGPARVHPKPVEMRSVPETPVNTASPANGTPKPELHIPLTGNEAEIPKREDEGIIEPIETPPGPASKSDEPIVDAPAKQNGASERAEMTGALQTGGHEVITPSVEAGMGEKRKLDDKVHEKEKAAAQDAREESERAEKKAKNSDAAVKGKVGRPKKDKSAPPVRGRTERKTRSQGPADA